jgi:hypothetical protein
MGTRKAEELRQRALEADAKAEKASDPEAKAAFREIAKNWRLMADQAERLGW